MTTYELPPEPPIGESVRDVHGRTWKHEGVNRWELKDADYADDPETRSWHRVLLSAPLTLVEPDPWPTAPLIVASVDGGGPQLLSIITRHAAVAMTSAIVRRAEHALTNVVPVDVVPVAELDALRASIKALGYGTQGSTRGMAGSLLDTTLRLLDATDALGVDL